MSYSSPLSKDLPQYRGWELSLSLLSVPQLLLITRFQKRPRIFSLTIPICFLRLTWLYTLMIRKKKTAWLLCFIFFFILWAFFFFFFLGVVSNEMERSRGGRNILPPQRAAGGCQGQFPLPENCVSTADPPLQTPKAIRGHLG